MFYRILDDRHFDEIQIIGTKAQLRNVVAEQYPEILRIQDMLSYGIPGFVASNQDEFLNLKDSCIFI